MIHVIGISEMKISNTRDDVLITYSLGSCIGLTLYDPVAQIGGLIHSMLPLSRIDPEKSKVKPLMFTDTGVAALLQAMFDLGADRKNLIAKVVGAASIMDDKGIFITPGSIFGTNGRKYIRTSLCVPEGRLEECIDRVR